MSEADDLSRMASDDGLSAMAKRRSVLVANLHGPGPDPDVVNRLLTVATRVPDHGKIAPWRFILFTGESRREFGRLMGLRFQELYPDMKSLAEMESNRLMRAPIVIAVISSPDHGHKVPVWEQELSAGAVCQNLITAATMAGFGAQWLTEWYAYDPVVDDHLGLGDTERVAGFIYIGRHSQPPRERPRPDLNDLVESWAENPKHQKS